jgi:hypothetical protein
MPGRHVAKVGGNDLFDQLLGFLLAVVRGAAQ